MTRISGGIPSLTYSPEALNDFIVNAYEWVDDLAFVQEPSRFFGDAVDAYVQIAVRRFADAGWRGDGEIGLIWVPPFALPERSQIRYSEGVVVWHVKQESDGTSWLLYPEGEWRW